MNLPATFKEAERAERLAFARQVALRLSQQGGLMGKDWRSSEPSRDFIERVLEFYLASPEGRLALIQWAQDPNDECQGAAKAVLDKAHRKFESECNPDRPTEMRFYSMLLATPGAFPTSTRRGTNPNNLILRNIAVAVVVAADIAHFGSNAYATSARRSSACAIAAEALDVVHCQMSRADVEAVWKKYGPAIPVRAFAGLLPI